MDEGELHIEQVQQGRADVGEEDVVAEAHVAGDAAQDGRVAGRGHGVVAADVVQAVEHGAVGHEGEALAHDADGGIPGGGMGLDLGHGGRGGEDLGHGGGWVESGSEEKEVGGGQDDQERGKPGPPFGRRGQEKPQPQGDPRGPPGQERRGGKEGDHFGIQQLHPFKIEGQGLPKEGI